MTIKKYRIIDIAILTALAILTDLIAYWVTGIGSGTLDSFFITPSIAIIVIIYIRWGWIGVIPNLLVGLVHLFVYQEQLLVHYTAWFPYLTGFMLLFASYIWKKLLKGDIIQSRLLMIALYIILNFAIMVFGEWLVALTFGTNHQLIFYMVRHAVNIIIALMIFIVATYQKGLVTDARKYIIQLKNDEKDAE